MSDPARGPLALHSAPMEPGARAGLRLLCRGIRSQDRVWLASLAVLVIAFAGFLVVPALADREPGQSGSPMHPDFPLLDADGERVLVSNAPVSTMRTCGACHDTEFIATHSFHADAGLSDPKAAGGAWETSPGRFGSWDPLVYRTLTLTGQALFDLGTPGWVQAYGLRHVGGGPATTARDGSALTDLAPDADNPETSWLDPETGEIVAWDWSASGVVEMNCFLCHTAEPDNQARISALAAGEFGWANTATLASTGLVVRDGDGYRWIRAAFNAEGNVAAESLGIQDPSNEACGQCHGLVHDELEGPLAITGCEPERYRTVTTGQIISPERLSDSGMNLGGKDQLTRSWDIHAERLLSCTDCHYSLNNPVYVESSQQVAREHLEFDPRRMEVGEYLYQPLHQFARGQSAQSAVAPELQDTMRGCESCHSIDRSHDWLPYAERHAEVLACETCHTPQLYSNALQTLDWTVLTADSRPVNTCRGIEGDPESFSALITGFQPAVLPQRTLEGDIRLAPVNLVTTWLWVYGDPPQPVRLIDLQAVWFAGEGYDRELLAALDRDRDGELSKTELRLDTEEKVALVAGRLAALGLENPRIIGEVQPYSINHNVASGEWALSDCRECHGNDSRLDRPFQLSDYTPGDAALAFVADTSVIGSGEITGGDGGALAYVPDPDAEGVYVFGRSSVDGVDRIGMLAFVGVLLGVTAHGGYRVLSGVVRKPNNPAGEPVYMYGVYERLWHWLQTFTISGLLLTGLVIHRPDNFAFLSFRHMVLVHNLLAGVLVVNAALALFYHLASGEIRQYLPRPVGFFDQAISQARYYLRGIFRHEQHPFEKRPDRKLNPLQQLTYLAILNLLLPLQVITGILMWGAQHWPDLAERLGGLPFLAPFHTLIAWTFAAFIVLHVYLTTTGHTPLTNLKAMMLGWEEHPQPQEASTP